MLRKLLALGLVLLGAVAVSAEDQPGNIDIRSSLIGTRVYLDDAYVGDADVFLEEVPAGEHIIILRQGSKRLRGEFTLKPGELLMLEGRFDESRIVDLRQVALEEAQKRAKVAREKEEARKIAEQEGRKQQKQARKEQKRRTKKKAEEKAVVAVAKPAPKRRDAGEMHVNILRVDFQRSGDTGLKVTPRMEQKIVTNFNDSSISSGKMYRTKQNFLLCEGRDCYRDWTGRFFYFDDTGKRDAFLVRRRETVFSGITPGGTSKVEVDLCVNGDCKRSAFVTENGPAVKTVVDRYLMTFNRSTLSIRRADLLKKLTGKGRKVPEF